MPFGPGLHHEGDAERPLATHAERRKEPRPGEVERVRGEVADPAEDRIEEDAERHRLHAADAVAQPAEGGPAERRADEEGAGDVGHPAADPGVDGLDALGRDRGGHHALEGGTGERGEERLLVAIHHPAEEAREERHLHALRDRGAVILRGGHG